MKESSKSVLSLVVAAVVLGACSGEPGDSGNPGQGGSTSSNPEGGATNSSAGTRTTGGSSNLGGASSSGGSVGLGGVTTTGQGGVATGGATSSGGKAQGGNTSTGGNQNRGGASTGGTAVTGGVTSTGGKSTGGAQPTGGVTSTGGTTTKGGSTATGGRATGGSSTGGAATGGVATGGNGTGGNGTGGNGTGGCGVTPVTPNATQQVKNVLCYLYSIYGKGVLSGQQETSWSNPAGDISWYTSNGMQPPAILGGDYLYDTSSTTRAIAYWNAGGLSMMRYHMGMPPNSDTYQNSMLTPSGSLLDQVITPGNSNYNSFVSKLDYIATEIGRMKAVNAPVILALFHEFQPNGWFWWSKGSADQFKKIWIFTFNYLAVTKGLNNIVWLIPSSGSPSASWFPAKSYYDIGGPDTYSTNQPFTSLYSSARGILGTTVPIALHETGLIPNPVNMFPTAAPWVMFNIWAGYQKDGTHNTTANIQSVYANSYTITRNEVPNLK